MKTSPNTVDRVEGILFVDTPAGTTMLIECESGGVRFGSAERYTVVGGGSESDNVDDAPWPPGTPYWVKQN